LLLSSDVSPYAIADPGERERGWGLMSHYLVRRILSVIPTLWVVYTVTFLVMRATPGGPWDAAIDRPLPPAVIENIRAKYHLDEPIWTQYVLHLGNVLRGDFGASYVNPSQSAGQIVRTFFPTSLKLGLVAMLIGVVVGVTLGVIAAVKQNTVADYAAMFIAVVGISVPSYVMATFLILVLSLRLHWVPTSGWGGIFDSRIVIPALALSLFPAATLARYTRAATLEVLRQPYVVTARAKGLRERAVVSRHVLKNSLIPVVTVGGLTFANIATGSFFIETVCGVPGIGRFFVTAVSGRDYPVLMAVTLLYAGVLILMNLLVDLTYAVLDPRIRL
jgi:ABC-type dipeptide/oligopeptide/nickel transport system permease component